MGKAGKVVVHSPTKITLADAFDLAWTRFLKVEGDDSNTPENLGKLAARIVVLFKLGETDKTRLSEAALIYLRASATLTKMRQSTIDTVVTYPSLTREADLHGEMFDPEAVTVMGEALALCLEDLPLLLPQSALSVVIANIMKQAAKGIRDPLVLKASALNALSSRI